MNNGSPGECDTSWFSDGDGLVAELRNGRIRFNRVPELDGYEDLREIGRGGQGVVYSARQRSTRRLVAIKFQNEHTSEAGRLRFEQEIALVAPLQHPHIVRIFDSNVSSDGRLFVVMEFIDGVPLDRYVQQRLPAGGGSPQEFRDTLRLFATICRAVNHAHQRGIMHRDLKPSNILVDASGEPHILDFGLARAVEAAGGHGVTKSGAFVGTLAYASPEQVRAGASDVDIRTDTYALGVMLYGLLTGRHPYDVDGPMADVIHAICEASPPSPSRVIAHDARRVDRAPRHRIGHDLDTIVQTAMAKDRDRRYQTAASFASDIERYLAHEPIDARRDSTAYLLRKLVRRHRALFSVGAVVVLVLSGLGVALGFLYQRARAEAAKTRQINYFLQDTLASVRPATPGEPVTMRAVLDDALNWLATLEGQPEIEAAVRNTIGNSYRALREYDAAETQLQAASEIRHRLFGEGSLQTAESLSSLGSLRLDQGRLEEAKAMFVSALAVRRRLLGDDDLDVAMLRASLARAQTAARRHEEAERQLRECLRVRRRLLGERHLDVAAAWHQLGTIQWASGSLGEACASLEHALALRRTLHAAAHPDTADSALALGTLHGELGNPEKAEALLRECVALFKSIGNERDPRAIRAIEELARMKSVDHAPSSSATTGLRPSG